ncbi:MAG: formate/nitrite transporter family protein [Bacilli bacterium]|nr:formate/nitrite transporter family protein [Bacilli bacterium]
MVKNLSLTFLKGILAGLSIGLGGFLYILMVHYVPGELGKVLGSLLFAVGLFLVCTFKFHLYTGKIGVIYEGKQSLEFYLSLPIMLIGNAIGAFGLGYICYFIFKDTEVMNTVINTCQIRTNLATFNDYLGLFIKSMLCGLCVYIAVKCFNLNRLKPLGIGLLVLFVFIFVYSGFQHCIANMFYFGFGNHISGLTFVNLLFCILFNSIGPIFGVWIFKLFSKVNNTK